MSLRLDRPPALQDMRSTLSKGSNWNSPETGSYMVDQIQPSYLPKEKVQMVKVQQMLDSSLLCNNKPM